MTTNSSERFLMHYYKHPQVPLQVNRGLRDAPTTVPEDIARLAYEEYSRRFGTDQSFERILERGGFSYQEVISLLADLIERERKEFKDEIQDLNYQLREASEHD